MSKFNSPKLNKASRRCAVCGSREHTRQAHGWTGRNMDNRTARLLAEQRKRS